MNYLNSVKYIYIYIYERIYVYICVYIFVFWHNITEEIQNRTQNTLSLTSPMSLTVAAHVFFDHPLFAQDTPCPTLKGPFVLHLVQKGDLMSQKHACYFLYSFLILCFYWDIRLTYFSKCKDNKSNYSTLRKSAFLHLVL